MAQTGPVVTVCGRRLATHHHYSSTPPLQASHQRRRSGPPMEALRLPPVASLNPFRRGLKICTKVFIPLSRRGPMTSIFSYRGFHTRYHCIRASVGGGDEWNGQTPQREKPPPSYVWPDKQRPRVCIIGGGFGGLYTALRLESLSWPQGKRPQVLLVDQSDRFVFKPMLYELLTGEVDEWEIAPRFSDLLTNTSVQFFRGRVTLLRPLDNIGMNQRTKPASGGMVQLETGVHIEYDWLVLALGAETKLDVVPGAAEFALPFSTLDDALKVNNKLKKLERAKHGNDSSPVRVVIVGCGYSGVELAATISERLNGKGVVQAVNVETTICPSAPPGNREVAMAVFQSRNVQLYLGYLVHCIRKCNVHEPSEKMTANEKFILELQPTERGLQAQKLEADMVLWTVGSKPLIPSLEPDDRFFMFPFNARGQAETTETLQVKGHPRIFAIGDSAALRDSSGRLLPANAQVAYQQADFAGWNIWAAINDRPLLPFRFQNLGEMMTLGRNDAAVTPSFIDGLTLDGPIAHTARKIAYLLRLPTDEHRVKVGLSWFAKTAIDSLSSLQSAVIKAMSAS